MKYAHNIEMRVFCKEEDNEQLIADSIKRLFPFDFEKEKIEFKSKIAETFENRKLKIFTVFIKNERHTIRFLKNLFSKLGPEQIELLKKQISSRLDDKLHFFIRLDKTCLLNNEYRVTDSGDCFHINICIAAYPHDRRVAKEIVKKILCLH